MNQPDNRTVSRPTVQLYRFQLTHNLCESILVINQLIAKSILLPFTLISTLYIVLTTSMLVSTPSGNNLIRNRGSAT